jgi:hypothetical protein
MDAVGKGVAVWKDVTNIKLRFGSSASTFQYPDFTSGVVQALTNANWKLVVHAAA